MSLIRAKGDLLAMARAGQFHVIVQGCNCYCVMGSGIARQIRDEYPEAWRADQATNPGDYNKLGNYSMMLGKQFNIINAYTQYNTAKFVGDDVFEYTAFRLILQKLAHAYPGCNFGFPYIGMGLAGGDSAKIIAMLEDFAVEVEKSLGTVTLVEFSKEN